MPRSEMQKRLQGKQVVGHLEGVRNGVASRETGGQGQEREVEGLGPRPEIEKGAQETKREVLEEGPEAETEAESAAVESLEI